MTKYFARKTPCNFGHTHASATEARRCGELHLLQREGEISGLKVEPRFHFTINGRDVKMRNGHTLRYTGDFAYVEAEQQVVEEVKAKNGFMSRDVPIKLALMAVCFPDVELRIVK